MLRCTMLRCTSQLCAAGSVVCSATPPQSCVESSNNPTVLVLGIWRRLSGESLFFLLAECCS